jgi:hypothetical protein
MRLLFVTFILAAAQICAGSTPSVVSTSRDGRLVVQLRSLTPERNGKDQLVEIIDSKTRKVLYSWESTHRSTDVLWSDDPRFFAVNDRLANSGDSLYVFAADFDGERLKALRLPDDSKLRSEVLRLHKNFGGLERCSMQAIQWNGSTLWTSISGRWYPEGGDDKHTHEFEFLWVYDHPHHSAPVLMQEWTQTFQYERE